MTRAEVQGNETFEGQNTSRLKAGRECLGTTATKEMAFFGLAPASSSNRIPFCPPPLPPPPSCTNKISPQRLRFHLSVSLALISVVHRQEDMRRT